MNKTQVAQVVTRIYTAAGRRAAETDFATWAEMLDDLTASDEEARQAVVAFVRGLSPSELVNIAAFRATLNGILKRRNDAMAEKRGLAAMPATTPDEAKANVARLREMLVTVGKSSGRAG